MAIGNDEFIKRMLDKQDKITDDMGDIKITLSKQEENLRLHVYRTDLAEQNIELLRKQIIPIETHVHYIQGITKLVGGLAILAGLIVSLFKILQQVSTFKIF